jgi:hypothetical protein
MNDNLILIGINEKYEYLASRVPKHAIGEVELTEKYNWIKGWRLSFIKGCVQLGELNDPELLGVFETIPLEVASEVMKSDLIDIWMDPGSKEKYSQYSTGSVVKNLEHRIKGHGIDLSIEAVAIIRAKVNTKE